MKGLRYAGVCYFDLLLYVGVFCNWRFGLGRFTTEAEVDYTADRIIHHVKRLREMRYSCYLLLNMGRFCNHAKTPFGKTLKSSHRERYQASVEIFVSKKVLYKFVIEAWLRLHLTSVTVWLMAKQWACCSLQIATSNLQVWRFKARDLKWMVWRYEAAGFAGPLLACYCFTPKIRL